MSHRVSVQESPPTHSRYAERGEPGGRRRLRQAHDVHGPAAFGHEGAQRVCFPQEDREHAVRARLEIGVRTPHGLGYELVLGPGAGAGEEAGEEDVDPGVDDERVAAVVRFPPDGREPLRYTFRIAEAALGVVGVLAVRSRRRAVRGGPGDDRARTAPAEP